MKLVPERPPLDLEPEPPQAPPLEWAEAPVAPPESTRTGREDVLWALRSLYGPGAAVVTEGFRVLARLALWSVPTPRPHWLALTLGFSQLDTVLDAWDERGRCFELKRESVQPWKVLGMPLQLAVTPSVAPTLPPVPAREDMASMAAEMSARSFACRPVEPTRPSRGGPGRRPLSLGRRWAHHRFGEVEPGSTVVGRRGDLGRPGEARDRCLTA